MNSFDISVQVSSALARYKSLSDSYQSDLARLDELGERIEQIRAEQATLETSRTVMDQVKKILTKSSLDYCEKLATLAVRSIFNIDAEVKYSATDGKFFLVYSNGMMSDIAGDEGGGMKVVISFIFSLYLVIKSKSRRLLFFDESFTQVSAEYFPAFIQFIRQICSELGFELAIISHDERLTIDDVDTAYFIENGVSKRIK